MKAIKKHLEDDIGMLVLVMKSIIGSLAGGIDLDTGGLKAYFLAYLFWDLTVAPKYLKLPPHHRPDSGFSILFSTFTK